MLTSCTPGRRNHRKGHNLEERESRLARRRRTFQNHMHTCQRRDALTEPTWQGRSTDCERGLIELRLGRLRGESREELEPGGKRAAKHAGGE